ncbi:hypothetical protein [Knoellia flava]|nr:hypothetical protein [Knoellia flava]
MSDAGAPDAEAYGALLGLLGLPGAVTGSVDAVWDAINAAHTGTGQVENGLNHMADRYDVDDDMAAFLLKPTVPVIGPAPSSGGGGGGGASIGPSYAASPSERSILSGAGILDSGSTTINALCSGNWVDAALSGVSTVLDAAATAADPLGSLLAAGIGWALDHLNPIKDWFNDVAGNPESVAAKGESWANIAGGMEPLAQSWQDSLDKIAWMSGDAISSYRAQADARITTLRRLKGSSEGAAQAMDLVAMVVSFVHSFLRDHPLLARRGDPQLGCPDSALARHPHPVGLQPDRDAHRLRRRQVLPLRHRPHEVGHQARQPAQGSQGLRRRHPALPQQDHPEPASLHAAARWTAGSTGAGGALAPPTRLDPTSGRPRQDSVGQPRRDPREPPLARLDGQRRIAGGSDRHRRRLTGPRRRWGCRVVSQRRSSWTSTSIGR